jgi:hypothetical protein
MIKMIIVILGRPFLKLVNAVLDAEKGKVLILMGIIKHITFFPLLELPHPYLLMTKR